MTNETRVHQARQHVARTPVRRGLSLAVVAAVAFAGFTALWWITHSRETVTIEDTITRVEIDVASGHVDVVGSTSGVTSLEFEVASGWSRDGRVEYEVDGTTLRVRGGCDDGLVFGLWCESDVTVTVPADADVVANATGGSMTLRGLNADAQLESSAGDLRVEDHSGDLTAHSAAGSVTVSALDAEVAKVTSSAGPVSVEAVRPPRSLDAESSADDVSVTLPDEVSYDVETDSSVGDVTLDVPTTRGSVYEVRAFSSAGAVSVTSG